MKQFEFSFGGSALVVNPRLRLDTVYRYRILKSSMSTNCTCHFISLCVFFLILLMVQKSQTTTWDGAKTS